MALTLTDEQRMLRDSVQAFLGARAPVAHLRRLRDSAAPEGYSCELWREFGAQGYCATLVPEAHGGLGLGAVEAGLIGEQLGHTLTPSPFLSTAVLGCWAIAAAGSPAQRSQLLPAIAAADTILALAVDEHDKHRPTAIATTATRAGAGFRLEGSKLFVLDGHVAQTLIVAARSGADELTLFLVDARAVGVAIERTVLLDGHNAARVRLEGVRVDATAALGAVGAGAAWLEQLLDVGRVVVAAELLGVADEVFARTLAYLKERRQFDRPIGEFQALQHRAAQLYCDIEMSRALVLRALQAIAAGPAQARLLASQAKAHACTTAGRAVREGVQLHGGVGMTDALDLGFFMKRARTLQELFGDAGFHAERVATLRGY